MVAICALTSPFLLDGRNGVSSVILPTTLPYIYTLSKKTSLALARLAASIVLRMIGGHSCRHILMSYLSPATRKTILDPETAFNVSSNRERLAATVSVAPGTGLGFR